jgi:hypothetical protein
VRLAAAHLRHRRHALDGHRECFQWRTG